MSTLKHSQPQPREYKFESISTHMSVYPNNNNSSDGDIILYDCESLKWLAEVSQWRALPDVVRRMFLSVIHVLDDFYEPRITKSIDAGTSKERIVHEVINIPIKFSRWLVSDFLINMDYYDNYIILRTDFNNREENYVSTARTMYTEQIINNAKVLTEILSSDSDDSDDVYELKYL